MAEKFSYGGRSNNKINSASLLLQPAASGFTLNQMEGNTLLMPVSQQEIDSDVAESELKDSFIGQSTKKSADSEQNLTELRASTLFNLPENSEFFSSSAHGGQSFQNVTAYNSPPGFCNPLPQSANDTNPTYVESLNSSYRNQQFTEFGNVRPREMTDPLPSSRNVPSQPMHESSPPFILPSISENNSKLRQETACVPSNIPPPKGPAQNYRITGRASYAPLPDLNNAKPSESIYPISPVNTGNFNQNIPQFTNISTFVEKPQQEMERVSDVPSANIKVSQYNPSISVESANSVQNLPCSSRQPDMSSDSPENFNQNSKVMVSPMLNDVYRPVTQHWFYCKKILSKPVWFPFSLLDSLSLEEAFLSGLNVVATDGGRYDVTLSNLTRCPVYWDEEAPAVVRRCTWFYKGDGERFVPYIESHSQTLEDAYKTCITTNTWPKSVKLGEHTVIIHNQKVMVHTQSFKQLDEWGSATNVPVRNRAVRRGIDDFDNVEDGEPVQIDHLLFVVHGIGPICDLKFRDVIDCVDDFRSISLTMVQSHFSDSQSEGKIGRVEFLPVQWHRNLHGDATGIDRNMKPITLNSIPKLRHFANDTVLDVLYYTSPYYCQAIVDTVCSEINRLWNIFLCRNPYFKGEKSVIGHSLGSLILYDLLLNQSKEMFSSSDTLTDSKIMKNDPNSETPRTEIKTFNDISELLEHLNLQEYAGIFYQEQINCNTLKLCTDNDLKAMNIPLGPRKTLLSYGKQMEDLKVAENSDFRGKCKSQEKLALSDSHRLCEANLVNYSVSSHGTGHVNVLYPKFKFKPSCFFALGSPVPMFLTVRGIQSFSEDFKLPTCPRYFNIFHPFDPVAYRMEPLIDKNFSLDPVLIPHHKGRKRLHLELKESLTKVGTDIKHKLIESVRNTWNSVYEFARFHQNEELSHEVDKVVEEEIQKQQRFATEETTDSENMSKDVKIGNLNEGRRIDYVLQEKPIESINQYLFALTSHACYWESEDTVLFILKELYSLQGIKPSGPLKQEPKLQLYNSATVSSVPEISYQRPTDYMQSTFSNVQSVVPQQTQVSDSSTFISSFTNQMPCPDLQQPNIQNSNLPPAGPPPLSGFVKTQIKR